MDFILKCNVLEAGSASVLHYSTVHCIPWIQTKLVKMTVGCGICHISKQTYVQYLHMRLFKNISRYIHQYCQLMLFTQPLNG
jgi:hypothetical protein